MAALSLVIQHEIAKAFAPAPKRDAGPSLRDQVLDLELLIDTVTALDPGDLDPDLQRELEKDLATSIAGTREKVDRTCKVLATFEAAAEAAGREAKRMADRKAYFERQTERLESYCIGILQASPFAKLEGSTGTLKLAQNPPSVTIAPGAVIDTMYMRTPPTPPPAPDKTALKAALQRGDEIPGVSLTCGVRLVRS
jgi:hypothetical protein